MRCLRKALPLFLALLLAGCSAKTPLQRTTEFYQEPALAYGDHFLCLAFREPCNGYDGWQENYYASVVQRVEEREGVLSQTSATDYTSAILGLTAAGYDPQNVAGYDLLAPLADWEFLCRQGLNAVVYTLLALDCGGYSLPACEDGAVQTTREGCISELLARQLPDGGYCYSGDNSDADMTAMVLQALAPYRETPEVANAVDRGLNCLSQLQLDDGGFASYGVPSSESCAQVLLAMAQLGLETEDSRFVKDGHTVLEKLLTYQQKDGSFSHTEDGDGNALATMQAFLALTSLETGRCVYQIAAS